MRKKDRKTSRIRRKNAYRGGAERESATPFSGNRGEAGGEDFFRSLIENSDDVITVLNADGTIRYTTPSNFKYTGYPPEEILGKNTMDFMHPDDLPAVGEAMARLLEQPQSLQHVQYRFRHKDGSWRYSEAVGRNMLEDPVIAGILANVREISERVEMERALKEEKEFTEKALDSLKDVFYVLAPDASLLRWNKAFQEVSGYSDEELSRMNVMDFFDEEDQRRQAEFYGELLREGQAGIESTAVTRDGNRVPYFFFSTLLRNDEGEPVVICGVGRDISEQKKSEEEILKFKTITDKANYGVAISDLEGDLIYINRYFASAHGYLPQDLAEKNLRIFHNDEQFPVVMGLLRALRQEGSLNAREVMHVRRDGAVFPMLMNAVIIKDDKGEPLYMATTAIDISERKQWEDALRASEERYRDLFETASDLIQSVTPDGRFVYVNRAWLDTLGYERQEVGKLNLFDIIHPDSMDYCREMLERVLSGERLTGIEAKFISKDGREIVVEGNAGCRFEGGKPVSTRGIFRDITARKQAEEELERHREHLEELVEARTLEIMHTNERLQKEIAERVKAEEELKASNAELDAFAHSVSHDLRGSLSLIKGFALTALGADMGGLPGEARECLEHIIEAEARVEHFIASLLAYSKAGHVGEPPGRVDSWEVLREVLAENGDRIEEGAVRVVIPEKLPFVKADPAKLYQVLSNLVGNALKYMGDNPKPAVEICCEEKYGKAVFCVRDNGIGIPAEERGSIFEPFRRGSVSDHGGLGIGLSTVRRAVEMWGGEVWVDSEPGAGSSFYFSVPLA